MAHFTFLVKSEKYRKICLACLDENRRWIRPIKPGGFTERDIIMDNGKVIDIFDVVDMEFGAPCPIKHHTENLRFLSEGGIKFVKNLSESERSDLLEEVTDSRLISNVESKSQLYDEIVSTGRSITMAGPVGSFDIGYEDSHPRFRIVGKNGLEINIPCTDLKFCAFIRSRSREFRKNPLGILNSQNLVELKGKQIYLVIGLTGDSLNENGKIKSGKYAPAEGSSEPRYWPMIISVLTVPDYS